MANKDNSTLETALQYYDLGWCVIPMQPKDKQTVGEWKEFQTKRPSRAQVTDWWSKMPKTGVAVILGRVSNLICVDIDEPKKAIPFLEQNQIFLDDIPTATQETHRGWHYFYSYPEGGMKFRKFSGGEVRSDGQIVILSPSVHPSGTRYKWHTPPFNGIAPPPESLIEFANNGEFEASQKRDLPIDNSPSLWKKLLTEDFITVGERNDVLISYAGYLRRLGVGEKYIFDLLRIPNAHCCSRPLPDAELSGITKSAAKYKAENPEWCFEPLSEIVAAAENLTWIVPNWLACGHLTLLTGPPKIGKSVLSLNLILALANGGKFLGTDVSKKRVGFVCCEEGAPILKDRIEKMGASFDNVFVHMGPKIIDPASQESLKSFVLDKNIDVLFLDPLVRLHDRKEDSPEAAIPVYLLVELARETKTAVLLVHHDRKSGGEYGSQIRGSSAIFGAVDLAISLKRFSGNGHLVEFQTIGRICAQTEPIVIELHPQDLLWSVQGTTQDVKFGDEEQLIVDALKAGMSRINEILSFTELPRTTCYRRLTSLENKNVIRKTKSGFWELI